jgi:hypothetical protein
MKNIQKLSVYLNSRCFKPKIDEDVNGKYLEPTEKPKEDNHLKPANHINLNPNEYANVDKIIKPEANNNKQIEPSIYHNFETVKIDFKNNNNIDQDHIYINVQ